MHLTGVVWPLVSTLLVVNFNLLHAQVPSLGGCPIFEPMLFFERERFMGTWYEAQRYFTVTELAARCISATYVKRPDGSLWINNAITNRFTGVERLIAGQFNMIGKTGEGKFNVKYTGIPIPVSYNTTMNVLDTDYESFAVIWSCNRMRPFGHTESVWVMTRDRLPTGTVMQRAFGVLDKFGIRRTFFIDTDQKNCEIVTPVPIDSYDPTESTVANVTKH